MAATGARQAIGRHCRTGTAGLLLLASCSPAPAPDPRPLVVVSVLPQAHWVEQLAGASVRVEALLPPGASHAIYEPTLAQRRELARAMLIVSVGHPRFPFERVWLDPLRADRPELPVLAGVEPLDLDPDDPHWWLSPRRVRAFLPRLEAALAALLPERAAELASNRRRFQAEIDALDAELRAELAPVRGHRFFVHHPAWGYFARDYGLEQVAVEHAGKEPDVRRLAALIDEMQRAGAKEVFVAPQFDASAARVLAAETGARVEILDPLARDWSANLRRSARLIRASAIP